MVYFKRAAKNAFTIVHVFIGPPFEKGIVHGLIDFPNLFLNSTNTDQNKKKELHNLIPTRFKIFHVPFQYCFRVSSGCEFKEEAPVC